jgi:hypothetical protein
MFLGTYRFLGIGLDGRPLFGKGSHVYVMTQDPSFWCGLKLVK